MEPKIVHRQAFTVMGVVGHFHSAGESFGPLWQAYMAHRERIEPLSASVGHYGVYLGADHSQPIDYLAGMAVQSAADPFEGVEKRTLPAATYAVFACAFQELGPTYGYIWGEWLQSSEYAQDTTKLGFDYYAPGTESGESRVEIWFPVSKKG